MSMASDRDQVKGSILSDDKGDPDLEDQFQQAEYQRLKAVQELHRHKEKQTRAQYGLWGFLGSKENAPNNIAFAAVLFAFAGFLVCLIAGSNEGANLEFWGRNAERSLAVALTALAYIFGRSSQS